MSDELELVLRERDMLRQQLTTVQQECTKLLLEKRALAATGLGTALAQVREFHIKFGVPALETVQIPDAERAELRVALIGEESGELCDAIVLGDLVDIADGIADTIYVCLGTALEFGIPIAEVFNEVHRTNMEKIGGATRSDGKILKPEGWQPPRIAQILELK